MMSCYCWKHLENKLSECFKKYQPLFKNKAIYRIVIYIKRFVRLVRFVFKEKEIVFNVFFVRVVIPKGWMVWMQDFWKLAYKKACRHDIRDKVSTRARFSRFLS